MKIKNPVGLWEKPTGFNMNNEIGGMTQKMTTLRRIPPTTLNIS